MDDPYVHTIYIGVETGTKAKILKNLKKSVDLEHQLNNLIKLYERKN